MPLKVSVVVPTYAPGDRINGLVRSLEAQTLPTDEWEVIFVDDGSPDDTWSRLQAIRDRHANVRIERIENSGWPSRPRNVGLELAQGEYVLFMDHDDELYPRALEAGYAMAARTGADVLNGKETRTDQSKWALDTYLENADNVIDRRDVHPLIPTNPHKLFKRSFLLAHDIRFPEGRRVLWEDVFFALDVAKHAQVVSNLSDTPFYHWVRNGTTASSSYSKDLREWWGWVREIVVRTNDTLAGPALHGQWQLMLAHQYRSRVLAPLAAIFGAADDVRRDVMAVVDEIVGLIPEELDAVLTPTQRGRAALLRAGRWDLLEEYVRVDSGLTGISRTTDVRWADGALQIAVESRWAVTDNKPLALRFDGERVVRDLPAHIEAALPPEALDMTPSLLAAQTRLAVRERDTAVVWLLPGECTPRIERVDGRPELVVAANGMLDPRTAAMGHPLDGRSWDVNARNELVGTINQRGLRTTTPARCQLSDGHVRIAYRSQSGMLSYDVDQKNRSLVGSAPPALDRVVVRTSDAGRQGLLGRRTRSATLAVPFTGVLTEDDSVLAGTITVGRSTAPARIVGKPDGAWLETEVDVARGTHPVSLTFGGRTMETPLDVVADGHGVRLVRRPT
jgi:hypothetical protein